MSFLYFIFDLLFLSILPTLGLLLARLPEKKIEPQKEEVLEVMNENPLPLFEWAATPDAKKALYRVGQEVIFNSNFKDIAFLISLILIILLSPLGFAILKLNPLSFAITIFAYVFTYIYVSNQENRIVHLKNIFNNLLRLNILNIRDTLQQAKQSLTSISRVNLVYILLAIDSVYLDLLIAKISLDKLSAATYIFLAVLIKMLIVAIIFALHQWLVNRNIFQNFILDKQVLIIFYTISGIVLYALFIFSKVLVFVLPHNIPIIFHTALPYVFATNLLITLLVVLFYYNHSTFREDRNLQNFTLHFIVSLHTVILIMLIFFSISSLEAVCFFVSGLTLILLTLFYHLFYRLHIYTQLV